MAWQKITRAIGGITPLGEITITPGTPIQILVNTALTSTQYKMMCRQIGISVDSTVAGEVYVNYGATPGFGSQTALVVMSSSSQSLPIGMRTTDGMIDATQWYLDGSAACKCALYLMDATD
jgi:hypothetical protein